MSDACVPRHSTISLKLLPADPGPIDFREYRTFAEALHFAYHHH
jgi:hypothetical protein